MTRETLDLPLSPRRINHSALQLILLHKLPSPRNSFTLNSLVNHFLFGLVATPVGSVVS